VGGDIKRFTTQKGKIFNKKRPCKAEVLSAALREAAAGDKGSNLLLQLSFISLRLKACVVKDMYLFFKKHLKRSMRQPTPKDQGQQNKAI
jgi:hypothetical protein